MRVVVLADDKDNPTFYRIEAKIRYAESFATEVFDPGKSEIRQRTSKMSARSTSVRCRRERKSGAVLISKTEMGTRFQSPLSAMDLGSILRNGFSGDDY